MFSDNKTYSNKDQTYAKFQKTTKNNDKILIFAFEATQSASQTCSVNQHLI